jgi:hypothetical protein
MECEKGEKVAEQERRPVKESDMKDWPSRVRGLVVLDRGASYNKSVAASKLLMVRRNGWDWELRWTEA